MFTLISLCGTAAGVFVAEDWEAADTVVTGVTPVSVKGAKCHLNTDDWIDLVISMFGNLVVSCSSVYKARSLNLPIFSTIQQYNTALNQLKNT